MAKNSHFFKEFWPIFDIFHRLQPYLCSKQVTWGSTFLELFGQCPYKTNTFKKGASLTVNEENCSTENLQTPLPLLTDVVVNRLVRTLICQSSHFGKGKKLIMYLSFYICSCWIRTLARPQARRGKNRPLWFFNSKSLYCSESTPGRSPQAPYHRIVTNVQTTFAKKNSLWKKIMDKILID